MKHFGIGFVAAIPSGANPTPIPFGMCKDVSIGVKTKYVKERGQYQHVVVVGAADIDITGKIGNIDVCGSAVAQIVGGSASAGSTIPVPLEAFTLAGTSYTVANGATFAKDYGVIDNNTGLAMVCVASAPATGQYSVNATTGQYTFAAADTGHKMSVAYTYTSATAGKTVQMVNTTAHIATGFMLGVYGPSQSGKALGAVLNNVFFEDFSLAFKPGDFTAQSVSFFAAQDSASTNIGQFITGE